MQPETFVEMPKIEYKLEAELQRDTDVPSEIEDIVASRDSWSATFNFDLYANGTHLLDVVLTVTIYRVVVPGGYGVFISAAANITPFGWMTNANVVNPHCGLDFELKFYNAQAAIFFSIRPTPMSSECQPTSPFWQTQLNQDIYPLVHWIGACLDPSNYYSCQLMSDQADIRSDV